LSSSWFDCRSRILNDRDTTDQQKGRKPATAAERSKEKKKKDGEEEGETNDTTPECFAFLEVSDVLDKVGGEVEVRQIGQRIQILQDLDLVVFGGRKGKREREREREREQGRKRNEYQEKQKIQKTKRRGTNWRG
jgi:hypothetical protein